MQNFEVTDHMLFTAMTEALCNSVAFTPIRFDESALFVCFSGLWLQF